MTISIPGQVESRRKKTRKSCIGWLAFFGVVAIVGRVWGEDVPASRLAEYQRIYQASCQEIRVQVKDVSKQNHTRYADAVKESMAELKARGELERYLQLKKEYARIAAGGAVAEADAGLPPSVLSARDKYLQNKARIQAAETKKLLNLTELYMSRLKDLVRDLMARDAFEEAKTVNAEFKKAEFAAAEWEMQLESVEKTVAAQALPAEYPKDAVPFRGHHYKVFKERVTWKQAEKRCKEMKGYLVCINSATENRFVTQLIRGMKNAFVGGTDRAKVGDWQWVNGDDMRYTNWGPGLPNGPGIQRYLWIIDDGTWDDVHDPYPGSGFVCEWDN